MDSTAVTYGREEARLYTPPLRELTPETSLGFAVIEFAEVVLNVDLLPWQRWLLIHALETDPSDEKRFRFRTVLVLVGRQNGKSMLTRVLIAYMMFIRGVSLILGTAQSLGIAEALWEQFVDMVYNADCLSEDIVKITYAKGGKRLVVETSVGKSEYAVQSAARKGGRGLTGDLIVLDELREHTTWDAWSAIQKTTLTKASGLTWCITNAGDASSVVLSYLRDKAHRILGDPDGRLGDSVAGDGDGNDVSLGFFEWSAPPGADPSLPETWAYANPSMGYLIEEQTLRDSYLTDPPATFLTECLCQWVEVLVEPAFPGGAWEALCDPTSRIPDTNQVYFGVDVSADRKHASIAACGQRADGSWHIELIAYVSRPSMVEQWFRRRVDVYGGRMIVGLQGRGCPAASLASSLGAIPGVDVALCQGGALTTVCGAFYDAVAAAAQDGTANPDVAYIWHLPQPGLDLAAGCAEKKTLGDGAWAWDRRKSGEDISPLVAATMAYGLAAGIYDTEGGQGNHRYEPALKADGPRRRAVLFVD